MARIGGGNDYPYWWHVLQSAAGILLAAAIVGLFVVRDTANAAYSQVQDQKVRIEALETASIQISVLNSKVDTLSQQQERTEKKLDILTDYMMRRGDQK